MSVPSTCQPIEAEVRVLQQQVHQLEQERPSSKDAELMEEWREQMRPLRRQLEQKQSDLQRCIAENPFLPLLATFTGRASLTIEHPLTPDAFVTDIVVPLEFGSADAGYRLIRALSLPSLPSRTFTTPVGDCTTSIRLKPMPAIPGRPTRPATPEGYCGYFFPDGWPADKDMPIEASGGQKLAVPSGWATIYFEGTVDHGLSLGDWFDVDSVFQTALDTESPMDDTGTIVFTTKAPRLAKRSFYRGVLGDKYYSLRIEGVVSPHP